VEGLLRGLGITLDARQHRLYDAAVQATRAQLDATTFDALWAEGQAMTLEQAIACALGEDEQPPESSVHSN
jgi:hypothetical protein